MRAQDTMYLLELRDRLAGELESAGRWSWAAEEFERLEGTRWEEPEGEDTGYMRIKGARDLDRRELAIFRELVRFRDGIARELDRATFRVAGNEALFAVAKERPQTLDALVSIKGVPRGIAERRGRRCSRPCVAEWRCRRISFRNFRARRAGTATRTSITA